MHVNVCESRRKYHVNHLHLNSTSIVFFILWDEIGRKLNVSDFCRGLKKLDDDDFAKG